MVTADYLPAFYYMITRIYNCSTSNNVNDKEKKIICKIFTYRDILFPIPLTPGLVAPLVPGISSSDLVMSCHTGVSCDWSPMSALHWSH